MKSFSVLVLALCLGLGASMAIMPYFRESDFGIASESTEDVSPLEVERYLSQFDGENLDRNPRPKPTKKGTPVPRPTPARPTTKKSSLFKCFRNGLFSDPVNCEAYYECTNMIPTHKRCDSNLYWDEKSKKCNTKQNVTCFQ